MKTVTILKYGRTVAAVLLLSGSAGWHDTIAAAGKRHKFKNVPDIVTTSPDHWHVGEEFNVFADGALANTSVDYGFTDGWNLGASILNVGLWQDNPASLWDPDILINAEKTFDLTQSWSLVAGTMNGAALWDSNRKSKVESYSYLDNQFVLAHSNITAHIGGYVASHAMTGPGDQIGFLMGFTIPLGSPVLSFAADYTSGNNALGAATLEIYWQALRHVRLNLGAQIPAPSSPNEYGAMAGFEWR